ncbi:MAG: PQQ-like beta-propeller repeat protein [Candidatus Heimdallarchaeota archaeon]|nr:PQQ-like beta-propeller repeat protein [Candidatus Heimdallarchaeota archaeon]
MKKERIVIILITMVILIQISFSNSINDKTLNTTESVTPELKWRIDNISPSSPPTVADLNYDNQFEVLVGTSTGLLAFHADGSLYWNTTIGSQAGAITITDLQNDGQLEILVPFSDGVFCFDRFGEQLWDYPKTYPGSNIFVIDTNNDNSLEILFCSSFDIYCLNNSGALLWKYHAWAPLISKLAVADLNSDGQMEILVSTIIYGFSEDTLCLSSNGTLLWSLNHFLVPYVVDLNNDGGMEILLKSTLGYGLVCMNATAGILWNYTGVGVAGTNYKETLIITDIQDSNELEIIAYLDQKGIMCLNSHGQLLWEFNIELDEEVDYAVSLCLADLDADNKLDVIGTFGENNLLICISPNHGFLWSLSFPSTGYFQGTPCVVDLDGNNRLEIIITTSNALYCYEMNLTTIIKSPWYCFGGTVFQTRTLDRDTDYLDDLTEQYWWDTDPQIYDTDADLLADGEEVLLYHTDPLNPDTDADGFLDGAEIRLGTDPLDPHDTPLRQKILSAVKALSIIIPSYIILCFILVLSIRRLVTQPWYVIKRALTTFKCEDVNFISLEKLIATINHPRKEIIPIVEKESFSKSNNLLFIDDRIYFLEKVDLVLMINQQKEIIAQIQNNEFIDQTNLELISQTKKCLQTIISLAIKLNNQVIVQNCKKLIEELNYIWDSIDFNAIMEKKIKKRIIKDMFRNL